MTITDDPKRLIAFMELLHERNQMQKMYVYTRKSDNRKIAILRMKNGTLKTVSYPRMLVENKMMRLLKPDEDVHHLDEDVTNNNINNLTPMDHVLHVTKHANKNIIKLWQHVRSVVKIFYGNQSDNKCIIRI